MEKILLATLTIITLSGCKLFDTETPEKALNEVGKALETKNELLFNQYFDIKTVSENWYHSLVANKVKNIAPNKEQFIGNQQNAFKKLFSHNPTKKEKVSGMLLLYNKFLKEQIAKVSYEVTDIVKNKASAYIYVEDLKFNKKYKFKVYLEKNENWVIVDMKDFTVTANRLLNASSEALAEINKPIKEELDRIFEVSNVRCTRDNSKYSPYKLICKSQVKNVSGRDIPDVIGKLIYSVSLSKFTTYEAVDYLWNESPKTAGFKKGESRDISSQLRENNAPEYYMFINTDNLNILGRVEMSSVTFSDNTTLKTHKTYTEYEKFVKMNIKKSP